MLEELLYQLVVEGGAVVTSNECSQIEIADAQATGRWAVDHEGIGYVRRYREWLDITLDVDGVRIVAKLREVARVRIGDRARGVSPMDAGALLPAMPLQIGGFGK